jgi:hypothetical protein
VIVVLVVIAIGAVLGGLFALGVWVGRGIREDQAADADARRQLAALEARRARPSLLLEAPAAVGRPMLPAGRPNYHPADYLGPGRLPGYADPFPRPGRLDVALVDVTLVDLAPVAPDLEPSRPSTSPDDLEAEVGRMIHESELYVTALIARTRHAERKYTW